jgi:hypothetical protein
MTTSQIQMPDKYYKIFDSKVLIFFKFTHKTFNTILNLGDKILVNYYENDTYKSVYGKVNEVIVDNAQVTPLSIKVGDRVINLSLILAINVIEKISEINDNSDETTSPSGLSLSDLKLADINNLFEAKNAEDAFEELALKIKNFSGKDIIDDTQESTESTYSSTKVVNEISVKLSQLVNSTPDILSTLDTLTNALTTNPDLISTITNLAAGKQDKLPTTGDGTKFLADDGNYKTVISGGANINDAAESTTTTYSSSKIVQVIAAQIAAAGGSTGGGTGTLDTIAKLSAAINNDPNFYTNITTLINAKVDKVDGKGLSTNDFTSTEKVKLSRIEDNANYFVHPTTHPAEIITEDAERRFCSDLEKAMYADKYSKAEVDNLINAIITGTKWQEAVVNYEDIATTYPTPEKDWCLTTTSDNKSYLYNGTSWILISNGITPLVTTLKDGLMSHDDKAKLDGIEAGANNYVHPTTHSAAMIDETEDRKFVTAGEKAYLAGLDAAIAEKMGEYRKTAVKIEETDLSEALKTIVYSGGEALIDDATPSTTKVYSSQKVTDEIAKKAEIDDTNLDSTTDTLSSSKIKDTYVAQETGKGLSSNDYDAASKEKVDKLITAGDGSKVLADDGTYKNIAGGSINDSDLESTNTTLSSSKIKGTYVAQETGKGLSSNDYDTAAKGKVDKLITAGDGSKVLADNGTYKSVITDTEIDDTAESTTKAYSSTKTNEVINGRYTDGEKAKVEKIDTAGDGTKFLADDGTYKLASEGPINDSSLDSTSTTLSASKIKSTYVAQETDKGLSSNDYDATAKGKVDKLATAGDGTKFLADNGLYDSPAWGEVSDKPFISIDGLTLQKDENGVLKSMGTTIPVELQYLDKSGDGTKFLGNDGNYYTINNFGIDDTAQATNKTYSSEKIDQKIDTLVNGLVLPTQNDAPTIWQKTYLNVTAGQVLELVTSDSYQMDKVIVQLFKFVAGATGVSEVIETFGTSDQANYYCNNDNITFTDGDGGKVKIKDEYAIPTSLNANGYYESAVINKSDYVDFNGISVEERL